MLVEKVSPAADQPESRAVGQPLVTLVRAVILHHKILFLRTVTKWRSAKIFAKLYAVAASLRADNGRVCNVSLLSWWQSFASLATCCKQVVYK
eukprot:1152891-Pelagomonas_calceolata.AAC.2